MKIAAFIPARRNSKRIPFKNRLKIDGELMISKVIKNLRDTQLIDCIYLSTDDEYLIKTFKNDANVTVLLRDKFIDDDSNVIEVLSHHQKEQLLGYENIIQVFPHSILIDCKTYIKALNKFCNSDVLRMMTCAKLPVPLEWTYKIKNNLLDPCFKGGELIRSQDLDEVYFDAGQFYIYNKKWFKNKKLMPSIYFELSKFQAIDLDTESDLEDLKMVYKIDKK